MALDLIAEAMTKPEQPQAPASPAADAPAVDMSPEAIERRLAIVSALHDLMRSLAGTGSGVPTTRTR